MCTHSPGLDSCETLHLSFYTSHYAATIDENVHDLTQIRDFEETEEVREVNRLLRFHLKGTFNLSNFVGWLCFLSF